MLSSSALIPSLLVILAGLSVALQQILNANLRTQLGSPWWAGFVSYFVGMVAMLLVATLSQGPRLSIGSIASTPGNWVAWTGGFFGAIFIATAIVMVPRLGAASVLACAINSYANFGIAIDALYVLTVLSTLFACLHAVLRHG